MNENSIHENPLIAFGKHELLMNDELCPPPISSLVGYLTDLPSLSRIVIYSGADIVCCHSPFNYPFRCNKTNTTINNTFRIQLRRGTYLAHLQLLHRLLSPLVCLSVCLFVRLLRQRLRIGIVTMSEKRVSSSSNLIGFAIKTHREETAIKAPATGNEKGKSQGRWWHGPLISHIHCTNKYNCK